MGNLARLTGMVDDLRAGHTGGLEIASFSSAAQQWVPSVVRRLREEFPGLVVDLALNETALQQQGLRADIDIRVEDLEVEVPETPGRCRRVLAEETYVCVVPRDHPLADRDEIGLADLVDEAWIRDDRVESMCTQIINRAAAAARLMIWVHMLSTRSSRIHASSTRSASPISSRSASGWSRGTTHT